MRAMTICAVILGLTSYSAADQQQKFAMVAGLKAFHASLTTVCDKPNSVCRSVVSATQAAWQATNGITKQNETDAADNLASNMWRTKP